jgi:pimeloyl-ACP methyl ester carboxylesterase
MTSFKRDGIEIYYEVHGQGFPVLLIAPGGMKSAVPFWNSTPWNPIEDLKSDFQVVAMDQRNAGQSSGPITGKDGWHTYVDDQLALMDHLGLPRFHVAGMCIGGSYAFGLIKAAPERVSSAVLFQTIGLSDNRQAFYDMFDGWAMELRGLHPEVSEADWVNFRSNMYDGEFLFTADETFVAGCRTPLAVLCGKDLYHPEPISRAVAELSPDALFIEQWKEGEARDAARETIHEFLLKHAA